MIEVLYGNEPYLINDRVSTETSGLDECSVFTFEEITQEVINTYNSFSLFSDKQVIIVRPKDINSNLLIEEIKNGKSNDNIMLVIPDSIDKRTKAFKALQGIAKEYNKLNSKYLQAFVIKKIQKAGAKIDADTYDYFIERSGYLTDPEVNLYSIDNWIKQLSMCDIIVTKENIDVFVPESINTKVFALTKCLFKGDTKSLFSLAKHFMENNESPIMMLSLLLRSFRIAYKASLYPEKNTKDIATMLGAQVESVTFSDKQISSALDVLNDSIRNIKSGKAAPEVIFITTLSKVCNILD